jgi:hypothetical protein
VAEQTRVPRPGGQRPISEILVWVLRLFAVLAAIAGVLLFVLSEQTDRTFSWTIEPPLTAAFLGASYWAAAVLIALAARDRTWEAARPAWPPVLTIATLLLVATLIHIDRFHKDSVFGWFWIVVYATIPALIVFLLWRERRATGATGTSTARVALPPGLQSGLLFQAIVVLGVGAALFVSPADTASAWPWKLTPLTARAVGAFVIGFGVAAADAAQQDDVVRFRGAALAYLALGVLELVAVARYTGDLDDPLQSMLYIAFLCSVLVVALVGWRSASRAASAS